MVLNYMNPIDHYITTFPAPVQELLQQVRQAILQAAPGAEESISYAMPAYKLNGKALVYLRGTRTTSAFMPRPRAIPLSPKH